MWIKYNGNPLGQHVGDCTVRAISKATGKTWDRVLCELFLTAFCMKDMPESNRVWGEYLRSCGYKRKSPPEECTVADFCKAHPKGTYILAVDGHVICSKDGNFFDTWDSGQELIVFFWEVK